MEKITKNNAYAIELETARFMSRVYLWMTAGILVTAAVAYGIASNPSALALIFGNRLIFFSLIIAQLAAVFFLSLAVKKISSSTAMLVYFLYAALTGTTLSVIFQVYAGESIAQVFLTTSFSFAGLSAFGYLTKKDLGPVGSFCTMGLFGLVGYGLISLFFPGMQAGPYGFTYSIVGVIVFAGLTAYDTQKIKQSNIIGNEGTDEDRKEAIYGALTLYLDFINLFLNLLRLMGRKN